MGMKRKVPTTKQISTPHPPSGNSQRTSPACSNYLWSLSQIWFWGTVQQLPHSTARTTHPQVSCSRIKETEISWEFKGYLSRNPTQKSHALHDIGLMDSCDLAPPFFGGIVKGKLCNSLRLGSSDNLQTLNDPLCTLGKTEMTGNVWKAAKEAATSRLPLSLSSPVTGPYLMFQRAIFPFCLFSNDYQV